MGHQIHRVVGAAALQGRTQQRRTDRRDQPSVGIRGDQLHPGQPAGHQVAERQQPAGPSSVVTVMPRTSRKPSALTPVACGPRGLGTRGHCPCTDVGKYQHNILLAALAVTAAPLAVTALGFVLRERCPGYRKAHEIRGHDAHRIRGLLIGAADAAGGDQRDPQFGQRRW